MEDRVGLEGAGTVLWTPGKKGSRLRSVGYLLYSERILRDCSILVAARKEQVSLFSHRTSVEWKIGRRRRYSTLRRTLCSRILTNIEVLTV